MKNRGFTLIELIGTIVILSLLLLIVSPLVTRSIKEGVAKADEQAITNIKLAAKNWVSDSGNITNARVTVSELIDDGYLDSEVKLPSTAKDIRFTCVLITLKYENENTGKKVYEYEYRDICVEQ